MQISRNKLKHKINIYFTFPYHTNHNSLYYVEYNSFFIEDKNMLNIHHANQEPFIQKTQANIYVFIL